MSKRPTIQKKQLIQCAVHDITIFDDISVNDVRKIFEDISKHYCFQKEKGEKSGTVHYQCRISLKVKCRQNELIKKLQSRLAKFHVTTTATVNKNEDFYCMKEETRVEGPFTDKNNVYIPRDVRNMVTLKPWQAALRKELSVYNERTVDVIIDPKGRIGKTRFTRYMEIYEDAETLDFCNDYISLMRMAYDLGPKLIYMIDMPRAISKEKLFEFYGAIETLKSGKAFEDRYSYRKRLFDPPRVALFCNKEPDMTLLSQDMWKLWEITDEEELADYTPEKPTKKTRK